MRSSSICHILTSADCGRVTSTPPPAFHYDRHFDVAWRESSSVSSTEDRHAGRGKSVKALVVGERRARRPDAIEDLRRLGWLRQARLVLVVDLDGDVARRGELRAGEGR